MGVTSLDAKDRAILYHLDRDARQSNSSIAKKTRLSKEVVNYRIKNLHQRGILQNFYTIIDSSKLGYMVYRVFIRFQNVDVDKEKEILDYLTNLDAVGWVVLLEEMYDLAVLVWAENVFDFKEMFDQMVSKHGSFFQESFVTIVTHIHHYVNNHLFNTEDFSERIIGGKFAQVPLDELDLKILALLAENARASLLETAKTLQVSPNTVKHRIKKMEKNRVIVGYKAKINIGVLGYQHYKIFLHLVDVAPHVKLKLREYLKISPNVVYVTEAVGRADLEFEMQVKSGSDLRRHLKNMRAEFSDVMKSYSTTLVNREFVVNYFPSNCSSD